MPREPRGHVWAKKKPCGQLRGFQAHRPEGSHSHHCHQFSPGQRAGGAEPPRASGSVDQETCGGGDRQLCHREPASGTKVSAGAQPPFCPGGGQTRGLSRAEGDGLRTPPDIPPGDKAHDQQRVGDSLQRLLSITAARERRYGPTQSMALCQWEDGNREVYYCRERMAFTELPPPCTRGSLGRPLEYARFALNCRASLQCTFQRHEHR